MPLSGDKVKLYKDSLKAPMMQRIATLPLVTGETNFVTVIDASGSMQKLFNTFIGFLEMFSNVIRVTNVNFSLMAVSDYDCGTPTQDIDDSDAPPQWYQDCVSPNLRALPRSLQQKILDAGYDIAIILNLLTNALTRASQNDQINIILIKSGLEMALESGSTGMYQDTGMGRPKDYVFSNAPSGLGNIITWLRSFELGKTIPGHGGDREEAFLTSILMSMAAAEIADDGNQGKPTQLCIIVLTDTLPHLYEKKTPQARAEREWCLKHNLPDTFRECIMLAEALGHHIIWCSNNQYTRFIRDYIHPYPHMSHMWHTNMMTRDVMSSMMLNAIVGIGMTGESLLPLRLDESQLAEMTKRLKGDAPHKQNVNRLMRPYQPTTNTGGTHRKHKVLTPVPMPRRDRVECTAILESFLAIVKSNPRLALLMSRLSPMIYHAKKACDDSIYKKFQEFLGGLKGDRNLAAAIQAVFVSSKLANRDQLEKILEKVWSQCPWSNKMLVYEGEPVDVTTFDDFGKFFQPRKIDHILKILKGFKIVDAPNECPNDALLDRKCLPFSVLQKPQFLNTVLALSMGNQTMPPQSCSFKLAVVMMASATAADILPQFRFTAMTMVGKNLSYLNWILNDEYVIDPSKNILESVSWWMHPMALGVIIKVLQTRHTSDDIIDRVKLIRSMVLLSKRFNDEVVFNLKKEKRTPQKAGYVFKCPSGEYMPTTLEIRLPGETHTTCVYCEGVHHELTEEGFDNQFKGTSYHMDGSPTIQFSHIKDHPEIRDICIDPDMKTQCSRCNCFYSVVDGPQSLADGSKRGRGDNPPLCVGCRKPRGGGVVSYIRTCIGCGDRWRFGLPADDWQCPQCKYGNLLEDVEIFTASVKASVAQLLGANPEFLHMYASNYGVVPRVVETLLNHPTNFLKDQDAFLPFIRSKGLLVPEQTFDSAHYADIKIPDGLKINSSDTIFSNTTPVVGYYEITNKDYADQLCNIKTTRFHDICSLGLCDAEQHSLSNLVNLCGGHCTFLTCKGCLRIMTQNRPGTLIPVARLVCPCTRPISQDVMNLLGKPNHQATLRAGEAIMSGRNDHRIGMCIGAMYPQDVGGHTIYRESCRGTSVCIVPPHQGGCGARDPHDDETQFRCPACVTANDLYEVHLADELRQQEEADHQARLDAAFNESELDIEVLKISLPKGTIIRRCPSCNLVTWRSSGCSHITCPNRACRKHWCWICRDCQNTEDDCYHHLQRVHNGYMFHPTLGNLQDDGDIIVATGPK